MIKLTDYIAKFLVEANIKHVFMLTGGGAMHLNDSLAKHPQLSVIYNHHEQASAMAAEAYARLSNKIAVVNVTTGPGGLNTLNGVFGAWTDSIPMLVISGQVRYDTTVKSTGLALRQYGDQEFDIVQSVAPMTKYATMITDAKQIKFHLQKALYFATQGRPGPVWLDIPMNIQGTMIDENDLISYDYPEKDTQQPPAISSLVLQQILEKLRAATRPVLLVGTGVRLSGMQENFLKLVELLKIPVVTAFNAHDLITENHSYYIGRPGTIGNRAGNFAVQNADLLLVLGCRLNIRQIGYHWTTFARNAFKIAVDIDPLEMQKPNIKIDFAVHADLADFLPALIKEVAKNNFSEKTSWLAWCQIRKEKYPVVLPEYWETKSLMNPYCVIDKLSDKLPEEQIIVTANATACIVPFQAHKIKTKQRLFSNSGSASMGYDLPAAIGACVASGRKKIICLAGDGSIQQNIQELATIKHYQFPIKIFVFNNNGYHSIRQTQHNFFGEPYVGVGPSSGLFFPDLKKIAAAYELTYFSCDTHQDLDNTIEAALAEDTPVLCEFYVSSDQPFAPKASSTRLNNGKIVSRPLEDLAPFLSREELAENMLIDLLPESLN